MDQRTATGMDVQRFFKDTHLKQRLPDNASIFTAELKAIDLALDAVSESEDREFIIFSDSLSVLLSLKNKELDNPLIINVLHSLHTLSTAHNTFVFCWIPSHIGIYGNEKADMAAKEALSLDITNSLVPYTDLKPSINSFTFVKGKNAGRLDMRIKILK